MNFLAHYLLATQFLRPVPPLSSYAVGTALPDLLPLAAPRARLRPASLREAPTEAAQDRALWHGTRAHLETDAAFHKTRAFADAQTAVGELVSHAGFVGIRVRRFFIAHVLAELALDAVLLRADTSLARDFYSAFASADIPHAVQWTETTVAHPLPALPGVLRHFTDFRYLHTYAEDSGVAEGLNRLCVRARQDTFTGDNRTRLLGLVREAIAVVGDRAEALLQETATAMLRSPSEQTTSRRSATDD